MKAALVSEPGRAPHYAEVPEPRPGRGEVVLDVLASAIHPLTRSRAAGTHYSSTVRTPLVPGVDGVGRAPDGTLRYFALDDDRGAMARRVAVEADRTIVLPPHADPVTIAAAMNPAMASWVALRRRIAFEPGASVLILGATGSAGGMAIEVASMLGAGRIVAAGRDATRLAELPRLGAAAVVRLGTQSTAADLAREAADVDVVLDFVWGETTAAAMTALVPARPNRAKPWTWIELGSLGGQSAAIPAAALRASRLTLVGSGIGSVPVPAFLAELGGLAEAITDGAVHVDARAVPLRDVEQAWGRAATGGPRIVLTPGE